MEEKSLSISFADSLAEESISCIGEYAEIGLDAIMEDGILKDIPIVSTAIAIYKIGNSIKERHNLKKLVVFLNELNNGITDEQKRKDYQQKFQSNEKFRNQEIEYLLVLIDRYISYDKPKMLAKLYLAYLEKQISWNEFSMYASVVEQLFPVDIRILCTANFDTVKQDDDQIDSVLRLLSVGVVSQNVGTKAEHDKSTGALSINDKVGYTFSKFGLKFKEIMSVYEMLQ